MPIYKVRCSRFEKWCVRFIVFRKDRGGGIVLDSR